MRACYKNVDDLAGLMSPTETGVRMTNVLPINTAVAKKVEEAADMAVEEFNVYTLDHDGAGVNAQGYLKEDGTFVILAGARFANKPCHPNVRNKMMTLRTELVAASRIDGGDYVLEADHVAPTIGTAATILMGAVRSSNVWQDAAGESHSSVKRKSSKVEMLHHYVRSNYPGALAAGRQCQVRGRVCFLIRSSLDKDETPNGFHFRRADISGLPGTFKTLVVTYAHGQVFEIPGKAILDLVDDSQTHTRVRLVGRDDGGKGYAVQVGNTMSDMYVEGHSFMPVA